MRRGIFQEDETGSRSKDYPENRRRPGRSEQRWTGIDLLRRSLTVDFSDLASLILEAIQTLISLNVN
jgi:hypothetical protein